jgi:ribosome modulation factor
VSNTARKERVKKLREAGEQAYAEGRSIHTCPERFMDEFQWKQGWIDAESQAAMEKSMHKPGCAMKLGTPSEEGTCAILIDCDCGQRAIEYAEIQRILDAPWPDFTNSGGGEHGAD